jgi:hypothetical protein
MNSLQLPSVFQQIDIEEAAEFGGGAAMLRMFGVTQVRSTWLELLLLRP